MKLTVGQLLAAQPALTKLAGQDLPIKASYAIARLLSALQRELIVAEDQRGKLVRKHGIEADGQITVTPENMEAFQEEFSVLAGSEIDIDCQALPLSLIGCSDGCPACLHKSEKHDGALLSGADWLMLGDLVVDDRSLHAS